LGFSYRRGGFGERAKEERKRGARRRARGRGAVGGGRRRRLSPLPTRPKKQPHLGKVLEDLREALVPVARRELDLAHVKLADALNRPPVVDHCGGAALRVAQDNVDERRRRRHRAHVAERDGRHGDWLGLWMRRRPGVGSVGTRARLALRRGGERGTKAAQKGGRRQRESRKTARGGGSVRALAL